MSLSLNLRKTVVWCGLACAAAGPVFGQAFLPQSGEYAPLGSLPGDQVRPQAALGPEGGYLVWQDNTTDGNGAGVSTVRLDSGFTPAYAPMRVNVDGAGDQENAQVTLLQNGGAAFIWQSGPRGKQRIAARFLSAANLWVQTNSEITVSSATNRTQLSPAIATLADGNVVAVWASVNQFSASSMQDIYAQRLSPTGQKIGGEFLVNQFTAYNQRTPAAAGLADGRFVIAWVSEQQSFDNSVEVFARLYNANGTPAAAEFKVNTGTNVCANPALTALPGGGFVVAWSEKDLVTLSNSWDVWSRAYSGAGAGGAVQRLNAYTFGDQFGPKLATLERGSMAVWTSLAQDGSWEGVYGRYLDASGGLAGGEFQVNTTVMNRQIYPTVATDGESRFLAVWSTFNGSANGMDLAAQRYVSDAQPLSPMNAPFVYVPFHFSNSVYQPELMVSWAPRGDVKVRQYNIYVNGSATPIVSVNTNFWVMTAAKGLTINDTRCFQVDYVTADGRQAPISASTCATTWLGFSYAGIPFEWMAAYYGGQGNMFGWPNPNLPVVPGGPTLLQVYLTGGDPLDATTWLRTELTPSSNGYFVHWNPRPGLVYQVQTSTDLTSWRNLGAPHFAAGAFDSIYVGDNNTAYYRVLRLR